MDAELKAKWVAALRSGEHRQGSGMLRRDDGRLCCLGVLCTVAALPITSGGEDVADRGYEPLDEMIGGPATSDLVTMNDQGSTFPEIADWIEANL